MNAQIVRNKIVPKEIIGDLKFPASEVLNSPEAIRMRKIDAQKAVVLGNSLKNKVRITFEDDESVKQVVTTVWGVTDIHLILKYGVIMPLNRIYSIDTCA